jgi:hypothetical protein
VLAALAPISSSSCVGSASAAAKKPRKPRKTPPSEEGSPDEVDDTTEPTTKPSKKPPTKAAPRKAAPADEEVSPPEVPKAKAKEADEEEEEEIDATPRAPAAHPSDTFTHISTEISGYGDTDHVFVTTPTIAATIERPTAGWSLGGRYLVDAVSAASVDIVSTASRNWKELRHVGSLNGTFKPHDTGVSGAFTVSREPDYLSLTGGGSFLQDFDQKNILMVLGYGYGRDVIGRHDTPSDIFSRVLVHHAASAAFTFVLDRATALSIEADGVFEQGDQSKPYRYIPMFTSDVAASVRRGAAIDIVNALRLPERPLEQLPTSRERYALSARISHRYDASTLRLDERLYNDSWGLIASTTDLRYLVDLGKRLIFWPHFRFHAQRGVSFWQRAYVSERTATFAQGDWSLPALRTGDRELGPLWTGTTGLGLRWSVGPSETPSSWVVSLSGDLMYTNFADALYVLYRTAGFVAVGLEVEL